METKIIGIILLICAALIFQYSYEDVIEAYFSPAAKLRENIEKDITRSLDLQAPKSKSNIHHVTFNYRSLDAQEFLKKYPPRFQTNKDGKVWLEIEVLDLADNESPGFITQTSVFELATKNKIAEFGETYYIKNFDKGAKFTITATPTTEMKEPKSDDHSKENLKQKFENSEDSKSKRVKKDKNPNKTTK